MISNPEEKHGIENTQGFTVRDRFGRLRVYLCRRQTKLNNENTRNVIFINANEYSIQEVVTYDSAQFFRR
jgi:hypothetical protein